ncbi:MAG: succinate dehydrogenase cytochrome b subunit [Verrucomicrobia bacterium]|nr:succinate dehydrogenase cytochrome b subunit [Verrucomicrobiota bacterium]
MLQFFQSSLGKKYVMAVSGFCLFGFVIGHMAGNLQIFLGHEGPLNHYAHFLQSTPELLWPARIGLLTLVVLHLWSALKLTAENRAARPIGYLGNPPPPAASYASRTMLMSGLIIAAFIAYHLLHFTLKIPSVNLTGQDFRALLDPQTKHPDVYRMMVVGYSNVWVSGFYILGMALLCLHLSHGVSAMFQSIGLRNDRTEKWIDHGARAAAAVIFVGNCSIPIAILLGLLQ